MDKIHHSVQFLGMNAKQLHQFRARVVEMKRPVVVHPPFVEHAGHALGQVLEALFTFNQPDLCLLPFRNIFQQAHETYLPIGSCGHGLHPHAQPAIGTGPRIGYFVLKWHLPSQAVLNVSQQSGLAQVGS